MTTKTFYKHVRTVSSFGEVQSHGGVTMRIDTDEHGVSTVTTALCRGDENYSKETGRRICDHRFTNQSAKHMFQGVKFSDNKEIVPVMIDTVRSRLGVDDEFFYYQMESFMWWNLVVTENNKQRAA